MSQKAMGVILMSSIIAINIVAMTNCISIAVAQYNPSTGQPTSSLSPPSTSSPPPNEQPTKAPVVNTSSPNVNSSTISSPPKPVLVGPSNYVASPITSQNQTNVNATSSPPSKGLFLGSPGR
jgi:hypothetical protein